MPRHTYADKVKGAINNEPVVLIVPKEKQHNKVTIAAIKENVDPKVIPVVDMKSASKGAMVLAGKTAEDVQAIKKCVTEKMSEKYEIKLTELIKPKILISGMRSELKNIEIIQCLKAQNSYLENADIEIVKIYKTGVAKNRYSAVLKIDGEHFKKIIDEEIVNIDWDKCYVKEYFSVQKCYKCYGYNHRADDCKNKRACIKCAGEHKISECKSEDIKCVNCINANEKFKLKLDVNHMASSFECAVFLRKVDAERKKINYYTDK